MATTPAALGSPIPYNNPHALSVSLPTWEDNIGWASGCRQTVDAMVTGYPRFFVHRAIQKLSNLCLQQLGITGSLCVPFPALRAAQGCVSFLERYAGTHGGTADFHILHVFLENRSDRTTDMSLYLVTFHPDMQKIVHSFWQHTGMGISSRYADACLLLLPHNDISIEKIHMTDTNNLLFQQGAAEKLIIRKRIAAFVAYGHNINGLNSPKFHAITNLEPNPTESDVFLYPTGMSAIWHAHQLIMALQPGLKSVCLGFAYTDTLKVLEKWGPGCLFYGADPDTNLGSFETFLKSSATAPPTNRPPVAAVFCECPSNPLLQSLDLLRLRQLADQYRFLIILDDTIANFVNVNVLQHVDIITTSLSKLFSGAGDVMGGSLVLNPRSPHYQELKNYLRAVHEDHYFAPDAIRMEVNSRDFASRVDVINASTRAVCSYLRSRSLSFVSSSSSKRGSSSCLAIKEIFYPEWITRENYDNVRRPGEQDGFGPLFSVTFISLEASKAFYDALPCAKGPSLGTNFTLACPYTILAHFRELEWAEKHGVEEGLVRISIGLEERDVLMKWFQHSVEAAEAAMNCT